MGYGILYGAERTIVEGFRTDSLYIGSTTLRVSQLLSAILVVVCLAILIYKLVKLEKHPVPYSPVETPPEKTESDKNKAKLGKRAKEKMIAKQQKEMDENGNDS